MALFRSPHPGFRQNVRPPSEIAHPVTGVVISSTKALVAEFGVFGPEQLVYDPITQQQVAVADVQGGFFDSLAAQEREDWTDEERETVEAILRQVFRNMPAYGEEILPVPVAAPRPWSSYDELVDEKAAKIPDLAEGLELVPETLRYERENLGRPEVIGPLEAMLEELLAAAGEDADAVAKRSLPIQEVPGAMYEQSERHGVVVSHAPEMTDSGIVKNTTGLVLKAGAITAA